MLWEGRADTRPPAPRTFSEMEEKGRPGQQGVRKG